MNKYCFPYDKQLTFEETQARDIMVNLFNPVLKFMFLSKNPHEFCRYGFNSCRQTAIIGAYFLKDILTDYTIKAYEGKFIEKNNDGTYEPYIHAFIVASKNDRNIIIDLSRTTKRLLFHPAYIGLYPTDKDYSNVTLLSKKEIDLKEMIEDTNDGEYYTGILPLNLISIMTSLINDLLASDESIRDKFRDTIYETTTNIIKN